MRPGPARREPALPTIVIIRDPTGAGVARGADDGSWGRQGRPRMGAGRGSVLDYEAAGEPGGPQGAAGVSLGPEVLLTKCFFGENEGSLPGMAWGSGFRGHHSYLCVLVGFGPRFWGRRPRPSDCARAATNASVPSARPVDS